MSKATSILFCFAITFALAGTAALANGDHDEPPAPLPPGDSVGVGSGGDAGLLLLVLLGAVVLGVGARANPVELGAPVILDDDLESGAGTGKY